MQTTVGEWSILLKGNLEGDASGIITHPAKIEEAGEGAISFIASNKYKHFAYTTRASALIVGNDFEAEKEIHAALIRVEQPYLSFTQVLGKFNRLFDDLIGTEEPTFIHDSASIGSDAYIGAFSYIGKNAELGDNVKIFPHVFIGENSIVDDGSILFSGVKVYPGSIIGKSCVIHSGAVIGSDGFGFVPQPDRSYLKVPQLGNVVIEEDVEIGANTTIDRATMGSTRVHKGTKLDNLVHVAHNVEIGAQTVIAAQTGISGSTRIGNHCMIGGQVGFVGHIEIADESRINAQSGVSKSIREPGKAWNGAPAFEYTASLRSQSVFRNLPDLEKRMRQLERLK
ncbi:MAG: UDP-3-O-(3-hydroxymyristoyl)glucosamine N-acyltransferase [Chitinophagales bacterium]|nr:UDP-3-O-(3-hydroxymyristoyl)glucosamine N-acyltransferase [Chitinophagales bacterium]